MAPKVIMNKHPYAETHIEGIGIIRRSVTLLINVGLKNVAKLTIGEPVFTVCLTVCRE